MTAYLTFNGSFTVSGNFTDSLGDVFSASGSGSLGNIQTDRFGNTTGTASMSGSVSVTGSGPGIGAPQTQTQSFSRSFQLGTTLQNGVGDIYPYPGTSNATYTLNQVGSQVTLQLDGSAVIFPFVVTSNITLSGSESVHATLFATTSNRAPVVASTGTGVAAGSTVSAQTILSASDADADTLLKFRFWDSAGGGYFSYNGQRQAEGTYVTVTDLSGLSYSAGNAPGGNRIWFSVYDGLAWSPEVNWTEQTIRTTNTLSTVTAPNRNLTSAQWVRGTDLGIQVSDADGDTPTQYEFVDGNGGADTARLWFGGGFQAQGATLTISGSDLANLWIQGGANNGTDGFTVRVNDGYGWSNLAAFDVVTRAPNRAPVVAGAGQTVGANTPALATSLISVSDADGDAMTAYRFWDSAGGGRFTYNGVTQASGQTLEFSAAQVANVNYVGATNAGSETLWAQVFDGQAWSAWGSWSQQTVRLNNVAPVFSMPNQAIGVNEWRRASAFNYSYSDADGDPQASLSIKDSTTGGARLWFGGSYLVEGQTYSFSAAQINDLWVQGGADTGANVFEVAASDGMAWSATTNTTLTTRAPNRAPVVTGAGQTVGANTPALATSLVNVSDADGDAMTAYRFWDSAGGGRFTYNGVTQASGQTLEFSAAQMANVNYVGATNAGSETLWAQVFDGQVWSAWGSWSQQTVRLNNVAPVLAPPNQSIEVSQWKRASQFTTGYSDADGDPEVNLTVRDTTPGGARLWYGGNYLAEGQTYSFNASTINDLWVQGGTTAGTDVFEVAASDGMAWSAPANLSLATRFPNRAPVVTGAGQTVGANTPALATSLISVSDADGDAMTAYRFWDSAGGGRFTYNGVTQASGQTLEFSAAQVANVNYVGATSTGSETLWAQVFDGQAWSAWGSWSQQTVRLNNVAPVLAPPNQSIEVSQWKRASQFTTGYSDADGDPEVNLTVRDTTPGGARLWYGGNYLAEGQTYSFNASTINDLWVQGGTTPGTDVFEVAASDGMAWSATANLSLATRFPNRAPVGVGIGTAAHVNTPVAAANLVNVTDADADPITAFQFWDSAGGGHFTLNGTTQAAGQAIEVTPATLGNLAYVGAPSPGSETLWVRGNDGQGWGNWASWNQVTLA